VPLLRLKRPRDFFAIEFGVIVVGFTPLEVARAITDVGVLKQLLECLLHLPLSCGVDDESGFGERTSLLVFDEERVSSTNSIRCSISTLSHTSQKVVEDLRVWWAGGYGAAMYG
jgi:hypothetical protein